MINFQRQPVDAILKNLEESLPLFQVIIGPRQIGKTTAAKQIMDQMLVVSMSTDLPIGPGLSVPKPLIGT